MPIRETPPEEGRGRSVSANWSNLKTARGERHECYACGKSHWFDCHTYSGVTQPCLSAVTNKELPCPRCTEPVETMGYVAVWRAWDTKGMFALVHLDQRERADKLQRGEPVWVGRDDYQKAGIYVISRAGAKVPRLKLDTPSLLAAVDLLPTLLKCWKLPQLAAWVRAQGGMSDKPVSLSLDAESEPAAPVPDPIVDRMRAAPAVDDAVARLHRHAKQVERNGNGAH